MENSAQNSDNASDAAEPDVSFLAGAKGRTDLLRLMKSALTDGVLRAGHRLPNERQIAIVSGLSRSTVREVLRDLDREGRLARHVGKGTFVVDTAMMPSEPSASRDAPLSPGELMEFRAAVEPSLAPLIVVNASEEQLARLGDIVAGSRDAATPQDAEAADRAFHECLYTATCNRFFIDLGQRVSLVRTEKAWTKLKQKSFTPEKWAIYWGEHRQIAIALHDRDADLARALLSTHLTGVRRAATLFDV